MQILWFFNVLVVLFSVDAAQTHKGLQGLSCVNDFVNNVSCTWSGSLAPPGVDCWITGEKRTRKQMGHHDKMIRSCKLKQHGDSPPGCSFVFENEKFNRFKNMPYIKMDCNGTLVANLTNYMPNEHIKMQPPGVPNVSRTANETLISWSLGSPVSVFFKSFEFEVQITQKNQEAKILFTQDLELRIPSAQLKGLCQVKVKVKPTVDGDQWSNWSPATSWMEATDTEDRDPPPDQRPLVLWPVMFTLAALILVVMLVLYRGCVSRSLHEGKPVPNPSKYFHTLHSVHGGNLKKWLNPLSASESFFTAQPCDQISQLEVCKSWDVVASFSPSSSSTSALLHFRSSPSAGSDTSGVVDDSSSSTSSFFSNMGYFMSSSSSARTDPSPAYFTYQDDFHNRHNSHNLHLSLCPSFTPSPAYESLKREPQSPDSGFGIGKEDEEDKEDKNVVDVEGDDVSDDHQSSPFLILPLHLPSWIGSPSSPPPTPNTPSLTQVSSDNQQVDTPVADASGSCAAWPLAGSMSRSSSMPVESCKTGYLTLKELQTTFSNKSI